MSDVPRGIRNNNPGNLDFIEVPARAWNGQIGSDGRFGIYESPDLGVRAMSHQLQKDYNVTSATTLAELINEWAPPTENNTAAYIEAVSQATGIDPDAPFDLYSNLPAVVTAIIRHENGEQPYADSDIATWVYLA